MKTTHKRMFAVASALAVVLLIGFFVNLRLNSTGPQGGASLFAPSDAYGRSIHAEGMRRGIIDSDGNATIVIGNGSTLRFESDRLLIDGYVAAQLQQKQKSFRVVFTEGSITVSTGGVNIANQERIDTRLAALPGNGG
ncbi:MAG: hypothetical protein P1V20_20405 [Verrucomicrobiales bacterium]|nr:hypothetical protein [Verrucomicrobiales bacterium]